MGNHEIKERIVFMIFALILPTVVGMLISLTIKPTLKILETLSLGYIVGLGFFTFCIFLLNMQHIPVSLVTSLVLLCVLISTFLLIPKTRQNFFQICHQIITSIQSIKKFIRSLSITEKFILFVFVFLLGTIFLYTSYWPTKDWDAIVLYDFRAKMFVTKGFMDSSLPESYLYGYPLLTSLAQAWFYLCGSMYPGVIHFFYYLAFLVLFYSWTRKKTSRMSALLWTLMCALSSGLVDHAFMTYTNLAYTVYLVSGFYYLSKWIADNKNGDLWLSAILIGLSTWTRNSEPFWLVPIGFASILLIKRRRWLSLFIFPIIIKVFSYFWNQYYFQHFQRAQSLATETTRIWQIAKNTTITLWGMVKLTTLPQVFVYFWQNIIYPNWQLYFIFLVAIAMQLYNLRHKKRDVLALSILLISISCLFLMFAGVYYFSVKFKEWKNIGGSATRMSLFMGPMIIYYCSLVTANFFQNHTHKIRKKSK